MKYKITKKLKRYLYNLYNRKMPFKKHRRVLDYIIMDDPIDPADLDDLTVARRNATFCSYLNEIIRKVENET